MSYVTVYAVHPNGDVIEFGDAPNNYGYAPLVWDYLGKKYNFLKSNFYVMIDPGLDKLWKACGTGVMTKQEDILLGSTFDRVWIRSDGILRLLEAQHDFHDKVIIPGKKVTTIASCIILIQNMIKEIEGLKGVAFNQCSVVSPFWNLPYEKDEEEGYLYRPYNVDTDREALMGGYKGKKAFELMADLEKCWETGEPLPD